MRHDGELRHVEHGAPLDPFSNRHDLGSDLDLSLTPSAETIINSRGAGDGARNEVALATALRTPLPVLDHRAAARR